MTTSSRSWMLAFLLLASTSALGADYEVGIGDDCNFPVGPQLTDGCFTPDALTITVGDSVTFFDYADSFETGPHNVVADDGSFRCAAGCDGEGGDGTPRGSLYGQQWRFTRTFNIPGVVRYHDEAGGATGEITVQPLPPAAFAIGPGITGAWYDPAQSGHGLVVEVLPGNRFYASWFAFNPAGTEQAWFTGIGSYSGNTAMIVSVVMPSGGRWIPNFDPKQIIPNPWGTLTFTFTDCNHGRVDFSSVIAGYGTGSMDLTRLTQPAGLACP